MGVWPRPHLTALDHLSPSSRRDTDASVATTSRRQNDESRTVGIAATTGTHPSAGDLKTSKIQQYYRATNLHRRLH
ncbi:hypothetical protein Q1695_015942 [Nippostrongylus brasiliensis]|nr:hypothetical protein Q1695_015942 [Nippostrongylus brasiliensis]